MSDPLFEAAVEFLSNGGDLPENLKAEQRFKFTAAAIKTVHQAASENRKRFEEVENKFNEHLVDAEGQWKELKARLNVIGGLAIIASGIIAALAALGII